MKTAAQDKALWKGPSRQQRRFLVAALLTLACVVPIAVAYGTIKLHQRYVISESISSSHRLAFALLSHLERTVDSIDGFLLNFGKYLGPGRTPGDIYYDLRNATLPASVIQLSFLDPEGRFVASNLAPPGNKLDFSDREHIKVHLNGTAGNKIFISRPVKGVISEQWTIQFTRAVRDTAGHVIGVLVASYAFSDFIDFYSQLRTGEDGVIAVAGLDGVVWARSTKPHEPAIPPSGMELGDGFVSRIQQRSEGPIRRASPIDGIERAGYFLKSSRYPLVVMVGTNIDYIIAKSREFQIAVASIAGCLGLALLLLAFIALRYTKLEQSVRDREVQANARQRESQFLQAIGRVPGISVVQVTNGVTSPIGKEQEGIVPALIEEHVRNPGFLQQVTAGTPAVRVEHFTKDGEEFEVQMVVAQLDGGPASGKHARPGADRGDIVIFALDQTSKRVEENKLYQMSKMAALGELVTGLAHEINQPLGVIRLAAANALTALRKGAPSEHIEEKIDRIVRQTGRMKGIIDHMRIFGRNSTFKLQPSDPADAIDGVMQVIGADIRMDGIMLTTDLRQCANVEVLCRQEQLEQVLINLILNARDAIRSRREANPGLRGEIDVYCAVEPVDKNGYFVDIVVRDNAGGVPDAILGKVFQPFFTTKPAGQGTGLGLSVSFGIVRDHGGTLTVKNDDRGAIFTIRLPGILRQAPLLQAS